MAYDSRTDRREPTFERKAERAKRAEGRVQKRQKTRSSQRAALRGYGMDDR